MSGGEAPVSAAVTELELLAAPAVARLVAARGLLDPHRHGGSRARGAMASAPASRPPCEATLSAESAHEILGRHRRGGLHAAAPEPCTGSSATLYFIFSHGRCTRHPLDGRDLQVRHVGDKLVLDLAHHRLEQFEALTLPLGERSFWPIARRLMPSRR